MYIQKSDDAGAEPVTSIGNWAHSGILLSWWAGALLTHVQDHLLFALSLPAHLLDVHYAC